MAVVSSVDARRVTETMVVLMMDRIFLSTVECQWFANASTYGTEADSVVPEETLWYSDQRSNFLSDRRCTLACGLKDCYLSLVTFCRPCEINRSKLNRPAPEIIIAVDKNRNIEASSAFPAKSMS